MTPADLDLELSERANAILAGMPVATDKREWLLIHLRQTFSDGVCEGFLRAAKRDGVRV
jgi:hypothetical protein